MTFYKLMITVLNSIRTQPEHKSIQTLILRFMKIKLGLIDVQYFLISPLDYVIMKHFKCDRSTKYVP